jgi:hypothetical protein
VSRGDHHDGVTEQHLAVWERLHEVGRAGTAQDHCGPVFGASPVVGQQAHVGDIVIPQCDGRSSTPIPTARGSRRQQLSVWDGLRCA